MKATKSQQSESLRKREFPRLFARCSNKSVRRLAKILGKKIKPFLIQKWTVSSKTFVFHGATCRRYQASLTSSEKLTRNRPGWTLFIYGRRRSYVHFRWARSTLLGKHTERFRIGCCPSFEFLLRQQKYQKEEFHRSNCQFSFALCICVSVSESRTTNSNAKWAKKKLVFDITKAIFLSMTDPRKSFDQIVILIPVQHEIFSAVHRETH